jgi:hypothetical protein
MVESRSERQVMRVMLNYLQALGPSMGIVGGSQSQSLSHPLNSQLFPKSRCHVFKRSGCLQVTRGGCEEVVSLVQTAS